MELIPTDLSTSRPALDQRGPAVFETDVRASAKHLGHVVPDEYRAFLLDVKGGRTADDAAFMPSLAPL